MMNALYIPLDTADVIVVFIIAAVEKHRYPRYVLTPFRYKEFRLGYYRHVIRDSARISLNIHVYIYRFSI